MNKDHICVGILSDVDELMEARLVDRRICKNSDVDRHGISWPGQSGHDSWHTQLARYFWPCEETDVNIARSSAARNVPHGGGGEVGPPWGLVGGWWAGESRGSRYW